jgi:superfamily I DNA and RNA helicase
MRYTITLIFLLAPVGPASAQVTSGYAAALQKAHNQFHAGARSQAKMVVRSYQPTYRMMTRKYNKTRRAYYLMEGLTPEEQAIRQARIRRYYRKRALMRR